MLKQVLFLFCATLSIAGGAMAHQQQELEDFIVLSNVKTGTHLIAKALHAITGVEPQMNLGIQFSTPKALLEYVEEAKAKGTYVVLHHLPVGGWEALRRRGYKVIFPLRDPRDQLVSVHRWLREGQWGWLRVSKISDPDDQLMELIGGMRFGWSPTRWYAGKYYEICRSPGALWLMPRFENLVGPNGGGSKEAQLEEVRSIAEFLGIELSDERIEEIAASLYGDSKTFRKGKQVGRWEEYLTSSQLALFCRLHSHFLRDAGYAASGSRL